MLIIEKTFEKEYNPGGIISALLSVTYFLFNLNSPTERSLVEITNIINRFEKCGTTGSWPYEEYYRVKGIFKLLFSSFLIIIFVIF